MANFFTPIELKSTASPTFEQYQIKKYDNDPFQCTQIKIQSLNDHRRKMMQWLKIMPISERMQILTYTNKQFVSLLMAMYQRRQSRFYSKIEFTVFYDAFSGYAITDDRVINKPNLQFVEAEKTLIQSFQIIHKYSHFDSIRISENLVTDIEHLFELFSIIENGISFQLTPENLNKYQHENSSPIFYDSQQYHGCSKTLATWFVEVIKKNISIKYYKSGEREQQRIFKEKGKQFQKFWSQFPQKEREKLINQVFSRNIIKIMDQYRQNIHLDDHTFPKFIYSQPKQIQDFQLNLINSNGEFLLKKLMTTPINIVIESLSLYKYDLIIQIQELISKFKVNGSSMKKKKQCKQIQKQKVKVQQKIISQQDQRKQKQLENMFSPRPLPSSSNSIFKHQFEERSEKVVFINGKKLQKKMKKKKSKNNVLIMGEADEIDEKKQKSQATTIDGDQIDSFCLKKEEEESLKQEKFLQEELDKVYKEIKQQSTAWQRYRQIGINRMYDVLAAYFLSFRVFGSHTSGLGLPSSDIDICVDPTIVNYFIVSFRPYRDKIIMGLQFLRDIFRQTKWASNFNIISTAIIPILTFQINLSIPYKDPRDQSFNLNRKKDVKIQIDLTIEYYLNMVKDVNPHLGFESTQLIKEWVSQNNILIPALLLTKHLLMKFGLNKSFTGGLSSFPLTILMYAYLMQNKKNGKFWNNQFKFLIDFANFISNLDVTTFEINLMGESGPFIDKKIRNDILSVINPLNGRNLTEKSFRFEQIKKVMKQLGRLMTPNKNQSQKQTKKNLRLFIL